ncbi:MAG: hypothetical protein HY319_17090 [Armatimonadetes bacterium]|nr:hypothetical protein [Armatimonadota bacterium]
MPFCTECRALLESEEVPACPECFHPLGERKDEPYARLLQGCVEPAAPGTGAPSQGSLCLREVSFTPTGWWRRVGMRWLRGAVLVLVLGLVAVAVPASLQWQAGARGSEEMTRAGAAQAAGNPGEAMLCLERAAGSFDRAGDAGRQAEALAQWAELALQGGDLEKAAALYARAAKIDPGHASRASEVQARWARQRRLLATARLAKGREHLATKQYELALGKGNEALVLYTDFGGSPDQLAAAHRLMGTAYYRMGSKKLAVEELRKALVHEPANREAKLLLSAASAVPAVVPPPTASTSGRSPAKQAPRPRGYPTYAPVSVETTEPIEYDAPIQYAQPDYQPPTAPLRSSSYSAPGYPTRPRPQVPTYSAPQPPYPSVPRPQAPVVPAPRPAMPQVPGPNVPPYPGR